MAKSSYKPSEEKSPEWSALEDMHDALTESTGDSIYIVDRECRYRFLNSQHLHRGKGSKEQILGKSYADFHTPEETEKFSEKIKEVLATGNSIQQEYRSSADNLYFLRTFSPVKDRHSGVITGVIVVAKDISKEKRTEEIIRESEEKYRAFFKTSRDCVFIISKDAMWIDFNDSAVQFFGYETAEELQRVHISDLYANKRDQIKHQQKIDRYGFTTGYAVDLRKKDGSIINALITSVQIKDNHGNIVGYQGTIKDITAMKQAENALKASEEKYRNIIENIDVGYLETDIEGNIFFFNQMCLTMTGYSRNELMGNNVRFITNEDTSRRLAQLLRDVYETGKSSRKMEFRFQRKDGPWVTLEISASIMLAGKRKRIGVRCFIRDITEQKKAEETIRRLAYHDPLTGLPNRLLLRDRLNMAIARAKRNQQHLAVLMLDLDKFKDVNDTLGHHTGDRLLQSVGDLLTGLLRKGDTVARMGGDEFLIVLQEIKKLRDSAKIAQKIIDAFQHPFIVDDHIIPITTSIGIAIYQDGSDDASTLVKNADIAMYRAKETGRNKYLQFVPCMAIRGAE